jgi:hypothetical protein
MTKYNPYQTIEVQAVDALSTAVSLCLAAGWEEKDVGYIVDLFFKTNAPATPERAWQDE